MKKRLIALLLCICMVGSMTVYAVGEETEPTVPEINEDTVIIENEVSSDEDILPNSEINSLPQIIVQETANTLAAGNGLVGSSGNNTMSGDVFLNNADTNNRLKLVGNVYLTSTVVIPAGKTLELDLNGFVLSGPSKDYASTNKYYEGDANMKRVFEVYGTLIINDSNPTKINKGTLQKVSRWIDNRNISLPGDPNAKYDNGAYLDGRFEWKTTDDAVIWKYDGTGTAEIQGGVITGGIHWFGGAILVSGGTLQLNKGTIAGNYAVRMLSAAGSAYSNGLGGAVYAERQSTITLNDGSISYNWADYRGGGLNINNSTIVMNSGDISSNHCNGSAGGISANNNSTFKLGPDAENSYTKQASPKIQKNRTYANRLVGGGGGVEIEASKFEFTIGQIIDNRAGASGGGIYCYIGGNIVASSNQTIISGNTSGGGGGGINIQYGDVTLTDCILENNTANSGGAVSSRVGNFTMTGGIIRGNKANENGGAVYLDGSNNYTPHQDTGSLAGTATVTGTIISDNEAGRNGGAFYVTVSNSTAEKAVGATVENCIITGNKAGTSNTTGAGGAIHISGGELVIKGEDTQITGNNAPHGGAFYVEDRTRSYSNPIVRGTTPYKLKDIYEGVATLSSNGKTYSLPKLPYTGSNGVEVKNVVDFFEPYYKGSDTRPGTVKVEAGLIQNNHATSKSGGALAVKGSLSSVQIEGGTFDQNTASAYGGAVYVDGGSVTMTGGTFTSNTAVDGGAVYITGGDFTMSSGSITNNMATGAKTSTGGGVYVKGGNITIGVSGCNGSTLKHSVEPKDKTHPIINNNGATDSGGGIALIGNGNITFYCGSVTENECDNRGRGENIYMEDGTFNLYHGTYTSLTEDKTDKETELVIVGGTLKDCVTSPTSANVTITYYHCNKAADKDNHTETNGTENKVATVSQGSGLNLPDGEKYWDAPTGFKFFGWTPEGFDSSTVSFVRDKDDYQELGDPIEANSNLSLYALWAPEKNSISYTGSLIDGNFISETITSTPTTYTYSVTAQYITIQSPQKAGYDFVGWYVYQDEDQNANWGDKYEPVYTDVSNKIPANLNFTEMKKDQFVAAGANGTTNLYIDGTNFGNITLVAEFKSAYTSLTITKTGWDAAKDANQAFMFKIIGDPYDPNLANVELIVTIQGNDSVTINNLPVGEYTVTELTEWSWRYNPDSNDKKINLIDSSVTNYKVSFTNTRDPNKDKWLTGDSYCENSWKPSTTTTR